MQVSVQDITSVPLTVWLRKGYIIKKVRRENKTKLEKTIVKKKKRKQLRAIRHPWLYRKIKTENLLMLNKYDEDLKK